MSDYKRLTDEDWLTTISVDDTNDAKLIEYAFRLWQLENQIKNGTLVELPCVREINSFLGKYEAVYFKGDFDTIQECVVGSIKQGWEIIAYYGNAHHKAIAEAKLEELIGEVQ